MGRRSALVDPPSCPRPGHELNRVTAGGQYGSPSRQLYKCVAADGTSHRFAGTLPRLMADTETCPHCDNTVHPNEGPVVSRDYGFALRLAASALIDVGRGLTYTEAAARARVTAGRQPYRSASPNGALVAEWLDVAGPVLVDAHAETKWPETVVLDSTNFLITNRRTNTQSQAFAIIGMFGYDAGEARGRLLGLYATHDHLGADYVAALAFVEALGNAGTGQLNAWAPPTLVLTDGESALVAGVRTYWGAGIGKTAGTGARPYLKRCEWHLAKNARRAMKRDAVGGFGLPLNEALKKAFTAPAEWAAFAALAAPHQHSAAFVKRNNAQVTDQVARRATLPAHHSIGAIEAVLTRIRSNIERRTFTFRNQRRMNLLLGLMRNHELRVDDVDHYTELLRQAATAGGGTIAAQRQGYCAKGAYDLRP